MEILIQFGIGGLLGYGVGLAIKKTLKLFLFVLGLFFLGLEVLDYFGFATIQWDRIASLFNSPETGQTANNLFEAIKNIALKNAAVISGFAPGFILGLRKG